MFARVHRLGSYTSCLVLILLVWAVGAPSLNYDFVYDDVAVVLERPPFWKEGSKTFLESKHWGTGRQATLASLDLDRLWDAPGAAAFHRTNLVLTMLVVLSAWALARRIGLPAFGAFVAAALFAVHPLHVDAVASVVGRAELLAALGVMLALIASIDDPGPPARSPGEARARGPAAPRAAAALRFAAVFGASLLGLFSKESAACLPLLLLAARWALGPRVRLGPCLVAVGAALALWAATALHGAPVEKPAFVDNPMAYAPTLERIPKAMAVLADYLRLTLWPYPLRLDRSYAQTNPSLVAGWVAAVAWLAYCAVAPALRRRSPAAALALLWFPLAFAITGNVVAPITTIMAERLAFLPSFGPCLLAGLVAGRIGAENLRVRTVAVAGVAAMVGMLSMLFVARESVWSSPGVYFPASVAASPRSAKAWYDYGLWLRTQIPDHATAQQAEAAWTRALEIWPRFHRANYELAESLGRRGLPLEGAEVYERFLRLVPDDTGALANITRLLLEAGRPRRANEYAQRLVALEPESSEARDTLVLTESALEAAAGKQRRTSGLNP